MKRYFFTLASILSLLLCAAVVALWVRSYWVADVWSAERFRSYGIASWRGALEVHVIDRSDFVERLTHGGAYQRTFTSAGFSPRWQFTHNASDGRSFDDAKFRARLGEVTDISNGDAIEREGSVTVWNYVRAPHWCAALLCVVLPVLWAWSDLRCRQWRAHGLCTKCGYDLRASPDRCPECGTPVPSGQR